MANFNFLLKITFIFALIISSTLANEVYYELEISYFDVRPDGVHKQVLGVNKQFPAPTLRAERYDILTVKVTNRIQDGQGTTIHWHGFEQFLTPWEDGPRMLTQCDIPTNGSYTYRFQVNQTGTYWYHSHHTAQITDGLWGVVIVDNTPEVHNYDGEFVLVLHDWYHLPATLLSAWYSNTTASMGGHPFPDTTLINGAGYYPCEYASLKNTSCDPSFQGRYPVFEVERGKTYRFRVVNPSTVPSHLLSMDNHKLEVIEVDGVDTVRGTPVDESLISTGTRSSYLVTMNGDLDQYWIRSLAMLQMMVLDYPNINPYPEVLVNDPERLAILKYKDPPSGAGKKEEILDSKPLTNPLGRQGRPEIHDEALLQSTLKCGGPLKILSESVRVNGFETYSHDPVHVPFVTSPPYPNTTKVLEPVRLDLQECCTPISGEVAPDWVNQTIILDIPDIDLPENTFKPGINNISYDTHTLDRPALVKLLRGEALPKSLNPIEINGFGHDYVVELIINDYGNFGHPLHLHGHTYWLMGSGLKWDGPFVEERDRPKLKSRLRRETMSVLGTSWMVLRFRADNPGIWLFHCHVNVHFDAALGLVFVEGGEQARQLWKDRIPQETKDLCSLSGIVVDDDSSNGEIVKPGRSAFVMLVVAITSKFLLL